MVRPNVFGQMLPFGHRRTNPKLGVINRNAVAVTPLAFCKSKKHSRNTFAAKWEANMPWKDGENVLGTSELIRYSIVAVALIIDNLAGPILQRFFQSSITLR